MRPEVAQARGQGFRVNLLLVAERDLGADEVLKWILAAMKVGASEMSVTGAGASVECLPSPTPAEEDAEPWRP